MGSKKEKQAKEKPLEKMTAKDLRDLALSIEGIVGVHAMNKAELINNIKEARGIVDTSEKKRSIDVRAVKSKIQELKARHLEAKQAKNSKLIDALRRRISNLKKKTRRTS